MRNHNAENILNIFNKNIEANTFIKTLTIKQQSLAELYFHNLLIQIRKLSLIDLEKEQNF